MSTIQKKAFNNTDPYQHSAKQECNADALCGRCFNNVVDNRGFILMLTPKVCTQSILASYRDSHPGMAHWRSKEIVEQYMSDYYVVGFVRNPFDRLLSCWRWWSVDHPQHRTWPIYGIEPGISFKRFVDIVTEVPHNEADKHWRSLSYDMISRDGILIPHLLVRFENLSSDYEAMRRAIYGDCGVKLGQLPHNNKSSRSGHYSLSYDDDMVEKVSRYFEADLINFDYEFMKCH